MEEIKVGEYVRTEHDGIGKILEVRYMPLRYVYDVVGNIAFTEDITKHSFNIIDLLEKRDIATFKFRGLTVTKLLSEEDIADLKSGELKLVNVLTHEQFESMKYEVK
ncbi:MAG: hypothetical protein IJX99_02055 [Clostridia bacterium]|nr:hypothetical protein [Clostridia bacterium]